MSQSPIAAIIAPMKPKSLAWVLLPLAIVGMAVAIVVVSNFQKEVGIAKPGKGGRAAVAAAAEAQAAASGTSPIDYDAFSKALSVAFVESRNMAITNPAETRLRHALDRLLDCLLAAREAWQAELEQVWNRTIQGSPDYWLAIHSGLLKDAPARGQLSAVQVRKWSVAGAGHWLKEALDLVD